MQSSRSDKRIKNKVELMALNKVNVSDMVIEIKLQQTDKPLDFEKDQNFIKLIEQEYASKLLEALKIEPHQYNIRLILKHHPLKNCNIQTTWSSTQMNADCLIIVPRKNKTGKLKDLKYEKNIQQLQERIAYSKAAHKDLTMLRQEPLPAQDVGEDTQEEEEEEEEEKAMKYKINYDINELKNKYIYPFNQNKQFQQDQQMQEVQSIDLLEHDRPRGGLDNNGVEKVLDMQQFNFPFLRNRLPVHILKELQEPIKIREEDIMKELNKLVASFPRDTIPYQKLNVQKEKQKQERQLKDQETNILNALKQDENSEQRETKEEKETLNQFKYNAIILKEKTVDEVFEVLRGRNMARLIGIFSHLSYWLVFGKVNPVFLDRSILKQMLVNIYELFLQVTSVQFNNINSKIGRKLENYILSPLVILAIKMINEWIFRNTFTFFFEEHKPTKIALDKLQQIIHSLFDPFNLKSRFIFLESDIYGIRKKGVNGEKEYFQKRLHGLSPFIDLAIPKPYDKRALALLSKKKRIDSKSNKNFKQTQNNLLNSIKQVIVKQNSAKGLKEEPIDEHVQRVEQSYNQKFLQIFQDKIQMNRLSKDK